MICLDIPMPDSCGECRLMVGGWCYALQGNSHLNRYAADMDKRPGWCPLKDGERKERDGGVKLSKEQETVCRVFSRRDPHGHVHCKDCPMVLSFYANACLKTETEKFAKRLYGWTGYPFPKLEGGGDNG